MSTDTLLFDPDLCDPRLLADTPIRQLDHPAGPHSAPDLRQPGEIEDMAQMYVGWLVIW